MRRTKPRSGASRAAAFIERFVHLHRRLAAILSLYARRLHRPRSLPECVLPSEAPTRSASFTGNVSLPLQTTRNPTEPLAPISLNTSASLPFLFFIFLGIFSARRPDNVYANDSLISRVSVLCSSASDPHVQVCDSRSFRAPLAIFLSPPFSVASLPFFLIRRRMWKLDCIRQRFHCRSYDDDAVHVLALYCFSNPRDLRCS